MAATGESRAHETLMAVPRERPGWHIHPRRFSTSQVSLSPKLTQQEVHNINATGKERSNLSKTFNYTIGPHQT